MRRRTRPARRRSLSQPCAYPESKGLRARNPRVSGVTAMSELERSAELIERMLADPALRRRFLADPAAVLGEAGLGHLAFGLPERDRAFMTLELRESRSSLAGVMVAAAAEAV